MPPRDPEFDFPQRSALEAQQKQADPTLGATIEDIIPRIKNFIQQKGFTPEVSAVVDNLFQAGVIDPRELQTPSVPAMEEGEIRRKLVEQPVRGLANFAVSIADLATGGAGLVSPFMEQDISFDPARQEVSRSVGFTPEQLQQLPPPQQGVARGLEIAGETAPFTAGVIAKGANILANTKDVLNLGIFKRMLVDSVRSPTKFVSLENLIAQASGQGGAASVELFGEDARIVGELTTAFGFPFIQSIVSALGNVKNLFSLSEERASQLVGLVIAKELKKNPEFGKALRESQQLQELVGGLRLDLVRATRSPSFNKVKNVIEVDFSELDIANRKAISDFTERIQNDLNVIRSEFQPTTGLPSTESLTAEALKIRVGRVVDSELAAVQKSLDNLEQNFAQGIPTTVGDRFTTGQASMEKFLRLRGRANRNVSQVYDRLDNRLILPREVFKTNPRAYGRALKVDAAGNKAPAEVAAMVNKMKKAFRSKAREVTTETQFDPTTLTQRRVQKLEKIDPRTNSFLGLKEIRSELGAKASQAARAGDRPLARRYNILLAQVNRNLDLAETAGKLPLEQAALLKEGNRLRRNFGTMFEDFEGRALFAKTNQSQLKTAFEDTLNVFIKPNTGKRASSAIDNMKRIFGDSVETKDVIRNELLRRMKIINGGPDEVLTLKGFNRFKKQYSEAIDRAGLSDDFADIKKATKAFEDNITAFGESQKSIENSVLAHLTKADDPRTFLEKALINRKQFADLTQGARELGPEMFKLYKGAVVETLTNQVLVETIEAGTEAIPVLSTKVLDKILIRNGTQLKTLLGNQHFQKIKTLQKALARSDPNAGVLGGGGIPTSAKERRITELATFMSLIRQVNQRVLSPQFVATNLTINNLQAFQSRVAREVWKKAMTDIDFATELARAATDKSTAPLIRSMFTPGFGILAGGDKVGPAERNIQIQQGQESLLNEQQFIKALNPSP